MARRVSVKAHKVRESDIVGVLGSNYTVTHSEPYSDYWTRLVLEATFQLEGETPELTVDVPNELDVLVWR